MASLENTAYFVEQERQIKDSHQRAITLIVELKTINDYEDRSESLLSTKGEELRQLLDIPKEHWLTRLDKVTVDNVVCGLSAELEKVGEIIANETELQTHDVVNSASDGLALCGVFLTDDHQKRSKQRRKMLALPTDVKLKEPDMKQASIVLENLSKDRLEEFNQTLHKLGYNMLTSTEGCLGFATDPSGDAEMTTETRGDGEFYSRMMCTVVPTAAADFDEHSLRLSVEAIADLQVIDNLLSSGGNQLVVESKCTEFFMNYGSHVNVGTVHFGGICKWIATYSGSSSSMKKMVEDVQNIHVAQSYLGLLSECGCPLRGDQLKQLGNLSDLYADDELAKVNLHVENTYGPLVVHFFPTWRVGLKLCDRTWGVVDRGSNFSRDFGGVWRVIQNHDGGFSDPKKLAETLEKMWHDSCGQGFMHEEDDVVVVQPICLAGIPQGKVGTDTCDQAEPYIQNIEDLPTVIRETIIPGFEADGASVGKLTDDMALLASRLRERLDEVNDSHQHSFLITMLHSLSYDSYQKQFNKPLTSDLLGMFCCNVEQRYREYQQYKTAGKMQLEAYLGRVALEISDVEKFSPDEKENCFNQALEYFQVHMTPEVNEARNRFVPSRDWESLNDVLTKIMEGNSGVFEKKSITMPKFEGIPVSTPPETAPAQEASPFQERHDLAGANPTGDDILNQLGLLKFYPRKIALKHVISIKSGRTENNELKLDDLPWVILQKLLMIDYRGRNSAWETRVTTGSVTGQSYDDDIESILAGLDDGTQSTELPNPMDIFLATFSCCDLMLRQVILEKMFMCRLSVPLVMPGVKERNLTFCLWALRSIVVECRNKEKGMMESDLIECPMKVASFVRIGKSSLSKSQLINDVINDQNHQTFFSKEYSVLTTSERSTSNGLIEAAWYLPSGRGDDIFDDVTIFLNLRGDAAVCRKQTELISTISSVITVNIDLDDLANLQTIATMNTIHQNKCKVVILLTSKRLPNAQHVKTALTKYRDAMGKTNMASTKMVTSFKAGAQRTLTEIRHDIRNNLSDLLKDNTMSTLQDISNVARATDVYIDENDPICKQGRELADKAILTMKDKSISEVKQHLLPIQKDLWPKWSKLLKERHRTTGKKRQTTSSTERDRLQQEMLKLRQEQFEMCEPLSPLMQTFFSTLSRYIDQKDTVHYYLQWLKLYFDKRSRTDLPGLRRKYNDVWIAFNSAKSKKERVSEELGKLKDNVKEAEQHLAEASCGLEHLFREVGQMYEASTESNVTLDPDTQTILNQLPMVAAKLLLLGHPIEFMDGDASNVPLTWVKAILANMATLTGDKRVFVLSVLGIQSSGKSTLMNTMFGLRFAVSAGRCTRGVYIQLVEVDKSKTGLPFDYILIVDTEGLRAPELSQDKHEHDNELATLVIGLGDVVILNIKGENVAEMKDVLQIAVHAFLRMKIVNEDINLQQTCVFIHQNVSAANAQEKMMHGRQNLLDNLDEMTKEAAELERFKDIQAFSQVIDIDVEKCVWYFSDLWRGDPPMAPANPGYSESVTQVRTCLLYDIAKQRNTFLSISDLKLRIEDLWNGILADDFVFSFRNSLAVKAYSGLEDKYHEVTWAIEQSIMKWSSETASIRLQRCETEDALDDTSMKLIKCLDSMAADKLTEQQQELEAYFEQSSLQEIIIQWKSEKIHSLKNCTNDLVSTTKKDIFQRKDNLRFELRQRTKQEGLEHKTFAKASELADSMKDQVLEEQMLWPIFDKMWATWVAELAPPAQRHDVSVYGTVESILFERLSFDKPTLNHAIKRHPLNKMFKQKTLSRSFTVDRKDIRETKSLFKIVKGVLPWSSSDSWKKCQHQTNEITEKIFERVEVYLKGLTAEDNNFHQSYATTVIKMVTDCVDDHNRQDSDRYNFTLPASFKVKLCVHVCQFASQIFTKMQEDYNKKHSAAEKLEERKHQAFNLFKNKVTNCTNERVASDLFCDRLCDLIKTQVREWMPGKVYEDIMVQFNNKYHLIVAILEDLAKKNDFGNYKSYLNDSKNYALKWLTENTNDKFFNPKNGCGGQTLYAEMAQLRTAEIRKGVEASIREATANAGDICIWLRCFCDKIAKHMPVREAQMQPVMAQGVSDLNNFERMVLDRITLMETGILEFFRCQRDDIKWTGITPYHKALDKLWGCGEQCPFCQAPCKWQENHNVSHQCIQHRPGGVGGGRWDSDCVHEGQKFQKDQLDNESCNYLIQQEHMLFSCRDAHFMCRKNGKCGATGEQGYGAHHSCIAYKTWLPSWDIAPSPTNDNSKYWMWFLKTYQYQLKALYDAKLPHIPTSWQEISKDEAMNSLRESF